MVRDAAVRAEVEVLTPRAALHTGELAKEAFVFASDGTGVAQIDGVRTRGVYLRRGSSQL